MSNALTVSKAAKRIGVHPDTLRRWTDAGKVPAWTTPAGHRRYNTDDLDRFVDAARLGQSHRTAAAVGEHALEGDVIVDAESLTDAITGHGAVK